MIGCTVVATKLVICVVPGILYLILITECVCERLTVGETVRLDRYCLSVWAHPPQLTALP